MMLSKCHGFASYGYAELFGRSIKCAWEGPYTCSYSKLNTKFDRAVHNYESFKCIPVRQCRMIWSRAELPRQDEQISADELQLQSLPTLMQGAASIATIYAIASHMTSVMLWYTCHLPLLYTSCSPPST